MKKNKRGSVAIEAVLGGTAILLLFTLFIGYISYIYPKYQIDQTIQTVADQVAMSGKLSEAQYGHFVAQMEKRGYTKEQIEPHEDEEGNLRGLIIQGYTIDEKGEETYFRDRKFIEGVDGATNLTPFTASEGGIRVRFVVPSKKSVLYVALGFYKANSTKGMGFYVSQRDIVSQVQ